MIIGVVGYGSSQNKGKQTLYNTLFGGNKNKRTGNELVSGGMDKFFADHPSERFYVPEELSTEIVPQSLIPGYRVRQLETDENPEYRSIGELLGDKSRNPHSETMGTLLLGIQTGNQFVIPNKDVENTMIPMNKDKNIGRVFVLIPAGNGKRMAAYVKPTFYTELKDGELKNTINNLLNQLVSMRYTDRFAALLRLQNIFHFGTTGNTVLLRKSRSVISLVRDGEVYKTFDLDSNFDRQSFMTAFEEINPQLAMTARTLGDVDRLRQLDEAGALQLDIAQLNTAGSSYSIYGLDKTGKMLKPEILEPINPVNRGSDLKNKEKV